MDINDTIITNATMSVSSGLSDLSGSWFSSVIVIGISAILITLVALIINSYDYYYKSRKFLNLILKSFKYFLYGIMFILILSLPVAVVMYYYTQASDGNIVPLKYTAIFIVSYVLISMLGYIFKKYIYDRIKLFEIKIKEEVEKNDI